MAQWTAQRLKEGVKGGRKGRKEKAKWQHMLVCFVIFVAPCLASPLPLTPPVSSAMPNAKSKVSFSVFVLFSEEA